MRRRSIDIGGFQHSNPVPNAACIGNILMSGLVVGRDPGQSTMPDDLAGQLSNVFAHVEEILSTAGGSLGDLLKLTIWLRDHADRELLNQHWVAHFPEPSARPARQVLPMPVEFGQLLVMCEITAVLNPKEEQELRP